MRLGLAPHGRSNPEREDDRADAGRADPPPRRKSVRIAERGRADRRTCADVRGEHRREDEPGAEAAAGDEEIGCAAHASSHPGAEGHQRERIDDRIARYRFNAGRERPDTREYSW